MNKKILNKKHISILVTLLFIFYFCFVICKHLVFFHTMSFFCDPGTLWHLRDGENIFYLKAIPYLDTFLSVSRPWISDQWLSDLMFFIFYKIAGFNFIYFTLFFLHSFFFLYVLRKMIYKNSNDILLSYIILLFAINCCTVHFLARPVIFSFFLYISFLYLFEKYRQSENVTKINFYFCFLFFLWANIHPSFVMAFLVWGIYLLEVFFKNFKNFEYKKYFISGLCILLPTFINPYFYKLHESILFLGSSKFFMSLNQEWQPIKMGSIEWQTLTLGFILAILPFFCCKNFRNKIPYTYFFSSIIFYIYALKHTRGITYASLTIAFTLSYSLPFFINSEFIKKIYILRLLPSLISNIKNNINSKLAFFFITIIPFCCSIIFITSNHISLRPSRQDFPYKISRYVNQNKLTGNLEASANYGGFIIWNMRSLKPVMDDRNTLLGENAYKNQSKGMKSKDALKKYLKSVNASYILIARKENRDLFFKSHSFEFLKLLSKNKKFKLYKVNL